MDRTRVYLKHAAKFWNESQRNIRYLSNNVHSKFGRVDNALVVYFQQAITRSRAANSKKEVDTKANQRPTTKTSECVFHRKYF